MLTGSLACSFLGEARSTHNIDLVIDLDVNRVDPLLAEFPASEFFVSPDAVVEAVCARTMFNIIDMREGDKVDFWLLSNNPFDRARFARRERVDLDGIAIDISTPEDAVLMKLRWSCHSGGSERQDHDARRVFEVHRDVFDIAYVEAWVTRLGLQDLWNNLMASAEPLE